MDCFLASCPASPPHLSWLEREIVVYLLLSIPRRRCQRCILVETVLVLMSCQQLQRPSSRRVLYRLIHFRDNSFIMNQADFDFTLAFLLNSLFWNLKSGYRPSTSLGTRERETWLAYGLLSCQGPDCCPRR